MKAVRTKGGERILRASRKLTKLLALSAVFAMVADEIPVDVEVVDFDTQADPAVAAPLVEEVVNDEEFVGVIRPALSGESAGVGDRLEEAGIPRITQSATDDALSQNAWTGWFRGLGNNSDMGLP